MVKLNKNIKINKNNPINHKKASEVYIAAEFDYPEKAWDGWLPIEYRRTGVSINYKDKPALFSYMNKVYNLMDPNQLEK
jgi:putative type II restriction endonuclease